MNTVATSRNDVLASAGPVAQPGGPLAGERVPTSATVGIVQASELLVHLDFEHFSLSESPDVPDVGKPNATRVDPQVLADQSVPRSPERHFWDEVVAVAAQLNHPSSTSLQTRTDPVTAAIAIVSARYSLPATEPRGSAASPSSPGNRPAPVTAKESSRSAEPTAGPDDVDAFDALASLLGLEEVLGLEAAGAVDGDVLSEVRGRAISALYAANVNRDSALKAASGNKG